MLTVVVWNIKYFKPELYDFKSFLGAEDHI